MLRIGESWLLFLLILASSVFVLDLDAAGQKEFGSQNNVYLTEWARLKHQAELGDPDALFTLGNYYLKPPLGSQFRKNLKKSAGYYFQAGIRGNAAAQYNLAYMLHNGLGMSKNIVESYVWFNLASLNPSPVAKHINQLSKDVAITLREDMTEEEIQQADAQIEFYKKLMAEKRYRMAKFPE